MNLQIDEMSEEGKKQCILMMLAVLHTRRTPAYAEALDSILDRLPACREREQLALHRLDYLAELEARQ